MPLDGTTFRQNQISSVVSKPPRSNIKRYFIITVITFGCLTVIHRLSNEPKHEISYPRDYDVIKQNGVLDKHEAPHHKISHQREYDVIKQNGVLDNHDAPHHEILHPQDYDVTKQNGELDNHDAPYHEISHQREYDVTKQNGVLDKHEAPHHKISHPQEYDVTKQNGVLDNHDAPQSCRTERQNFVYVKSFKCASETLASVFRRFGYHRNLDFALPVGRKVYLGWPYPIEGDMIRPTDTNWFNILIDHAIYNKTRMDVIMKPGTVYITSIREPFHQFTSLFHYARIARAAGIQTPSHVTQDGASFDPITEYLRNLDYYEERYTGKKAIKRYCIPDGFHVTRNQMSFGLGFPLGFPPGSPDLSRHSQAISDWLTQIERDFLLVLIVERFDESMVLLKRLMCWKIKDIFYHKKNMGKYTPTEKVNEENLEIYRNWSSVDFKLYDHFTKVFQEKVEAQGPEFTKEVNHFTRINNQVSTFCNNFKNSSSLTSFYIEESPWNEGFPFSNLDCYVLRERLMKEVKYIHDKRYPNTEQPKPKRLTC